MNNIAWTYGQQDGGADGAPGAGDQEEAAHPEGRPPRQAEGHGQPRQDVPGQGQDSRGSRVQRGGAGRRWERIAGNKNEDG